ncbi:MAG: NgoFVII family restriction endonuclease [Urechidicola sp.]|nr:NgoFVII family restriction endonuclease [Urechidicola sp.]
MLYTQNLEELIFHRHEMHDTDEFIVLSGYLGPKPVARIEELPFNSKVIYGMYGSEGIRPSLHNSLIGIQNSVDNLNH